MPVESASLAETSSSRGPTLESGGDVERRCGETQAQRPDWRLNGSRCLDISLEISFDINQLESAVSIIGFNAAKGNGQQES